MRIATYQPCSLIDYPGQLSAIVFTIGCNFHCPYCHNPELVNETVDPVDSDDFLEFLAGRQGKLDGVTITGGEPTMHDDLPDLLRKIKGLGFKIKLDSNGTNPSMLRAVIDEGLVDYIAMDIKAPLAKYSGTVARPVDVEHIVESITLLLKGEVDYEFRTTVIKSLLPREDFPAIGEMIRGARVYYLQKFIPTKILNPAFLRKTTYTDEEFMDIAGIMEEYVDTCRVR